MNAVADRFRRLAHRFTEAVEASEGHLDAPTPCEGWSIADVIDHVVTSEHEFLGRHGLAPELPADPPPHRWAVARDAMQAALDDESIAMTAFDGYFGPTTIAETADTFYSLDLLVHAWDIARALARADLEAMSPADLVHARHQLAGAGDVVRSPGIFGPEVAVGADASDQDRFLAWTGRTP